MGIKFPGERLFRSEEQEGSVGVGRTLCYVSVDTAVYPGLPKSGGRGGLCWILDRDRRIPLESLRRCSPPSRDKKRHTILTFVLDSVVW